MQALLELDCMPSGMELFPAANEEQWEWIKKVIDGSDYYVVVLGGRYGTISKHTGLSYTEMEYRYALEVGKPVIGFIHEQPEKIEKGKSESSTKANEKLDSFRELVSSKLCKYWSNPSDLGAKVSRSITQLIKHHPAAGWINADMVSENTSKELLALRVKNEELEEKLRKARVEKPAGTEELAQGEDPFSIEFGYETKKASIGKNKNTYWRKGERYSGSIDVTWDEIFGYVGPNMISPMPEGWVISYLNHLVAGYSRKDLSQKHPENKIDDVKINVDSLQTIKIQLRALNLIALNDEGNWGLTPYGDSYLTSILAMKKA